MRAGLLPGMLALTSGCFLLLERIDGEPCQNESPFCAENSLILCQRDDIFTVDCGAETCDALHGICSQCGDNIVSLQDNAEQCDDGNLLDGDGCDSNCAVSGCGSGVFLPGELCFAPTSSVPLPSSPRDVALTDLDQDNDLDMVVLLVEAGDGVVQFFQNDAGVFTPMPGIPSFVAGRQSSSLEVADIDRDGRHDLLVASPPDENVYYVLRSADGFAAPVGVSTGESGPHSIIVADFNNDSTPDAAVAHLGCRDTVAFQCTLRVLPDGGLGGVIAVAAGNFRTQKTLFASDLDEDTDPDLLATFPETNEIGASQNRGGFVFDAPEFSFVVAVTEEPISAIAIALPGQPRPDLFVLTRDANNLGALIPFENNGAFSFTQGSPLPLTPLAPTALATADFDQDAVQDIAILFEDRVELRRADDLSLLRELLLSSPGAASIVLGDVNNDLVLDLVVVRPATNELELLLSAP